MRETIYPQDSVAVPPGLDSHNRWDLVPDTLPAMEFAPTTVGKVVRTNLPAAEPISHGSGCDSTAMQKSRSCSIGPLWSPDFLN